MNSLATPEQQLILILPHKFLSTLYSPKKYHRGFKTFCFSVWTPPEISLSLFGWKDRHSLVVNFILANESSLWLSGQFDQMHLEPTIYSFQSTSGWYGRDPARLPKITKSLCTESRCLPLVSLFYFITARGFVFVGEAIRTSHIGVFLPRLIYLQGKLLGGHKVSPRKIPTKFFPGPVPLIYSLGQQWVASWGTRVSFSYLSQIHLNSKGPHLNQEFLVFWKCHFSWISSSVV